MEHVKHLKEAISKTPAKDVGNMTGQTAALTNKLLRKHRQWGGEAQKTHQSKGLDGCYLNGDLNKPTFETTEEIYTLNV